jgi:hypothetical protein
MCEIIRFARFIKIMMKTRLTSVVVALLLSSMASGCAVIAVADAAISVGATAVKIGAKTVGAVVDVVIPDGDDKDKEKK